MSTTHALLAKLGAALLVMGLIGCTAPAGQAVAPTEVPAATKAAAHWTYEGEDGPEHWGKLDHAYLLCIDGTAQTPIDITAQSTNDVADPVFGYSAGAADFVKTDTRPKRCLLLATHRPSARRCTRSSSPTSTPRVCMPSTV